MSPKTANTMFENNFTDMLLGDEPMTREAMEIAAPREVADPLAFVTGGKAFFTLRSVKTGTRFTYRVTAIEDDGRNGYSVHEHESRAYFVSLLNGPDNWQNYRYIGLVGRDRRFRLTAKSTVSADATSVRAFAWTWERLAAGRSIDGVEVWHEGKCGRCGRKLTVPESIATGFGPECASKLM